MTKEEAAAKARSVVNDWCNETASHHHGREPILSKVDTELLETRITAALLEASQRPVIKSWNEFNEWALKEEFDSRLSLLDLTDIYAFFSTPTEGDMTPKIEASQRPVSDCRLELKQASVRFNELAKTISAYEKDCEHALWVEPRPLEAKPAVTDEEIQKAAETCADGYLSRDDRDWSFVKDAFLEGVYSRDKLTGGGG